MSLSIGIGLGMGRSGGTSTPAAQLTALVASLGGYTIFPGQHTYGDMTAAYPQTALPTDGSIGYIGDARNQTVAENLIPDSAMAGGTDSSFPPTWSKTDNQGISVTCVGKGVDSQGQPYQLVRISGTALATAYPAIYFVGNSYDPAGSAGMLFNGAARIKLYSGNSTGFSNIYYRGVSGKNSSNANVFADLFAQDIKSVVSDTEQVFTKIARLTDSSTVAVNSHIIGVVASGQTVDITLQISQPQLNRGNPTAYVPTYGTAISRPVFAQASQDTTANMPILRDVSGVKWAEYDGVNDHLITGITTPSSGYICVVANQTEALGAGNTLCGAASTSTPIAGVFLRIEATGKVRHTRVAPDGSSVSVDTTGVITVGTPFIADASWTTASSRSGLNGVSSTSPVAKDASSSQILLIGANNTHATPGSVNAAALFQGNIAAVVFIPNVTLPEATEQQIRQLAGQIYGISTL